MAKRDRRGARRARRRRGAGERGEPTQRIREAAAEHDVVALGRSGWSRHPAHRLGQTAAALMASSRGLLIPYDRDRTRALLLLFGAGE